MRGGDNSDTETAENAGKVGAFGVFTKTGSGDAFNTGDNFLSIGTELKFDGQDTLLIVLGEREIFDETFLLKNVGDSDFDIGSGNFYLIMVDGIGIANAGEHISNRISHCHR